MAGEGFSKEVVFKQRLEGYSVFARQWRKGIKAEGVVRAKAHQILGTQRGLKAAQVEGKGAWRPRLQELVSIPRQRELWGFY